MRINRRLKIKNAAPVVHEIDRVMVTWLEYQGDQRYLLTRTFESVGEARQFSARLDQPVEIKEIAY